MTLQVEKKLTTVEDLEKLPSTQRYELIEGELIKIAPASLKHGIIASRIMRYLANFVAEQGLGEVTTAETGFEIQRNPDTVRAPDMAFIPVDCLPTRDDEIPAGFSKIVPALVVEVISPGDTSAEVEDKTQMWLKFGVAEVWNVYLNGKRVLVHYQDGQVKVYQEVVLSETVLQGFTLPLNDIFR